MATTYFIRTPQGHGYYLDVKEGQEIVYEASSRYPFEVELRDERGTIGIFFATSFVEVGVLDQFSLDLPWINNLNFWGLI